MLWRAIKLLTAPKLHIQVHTTVYFLNGQPSFQKSSSDANFFRVTLPNVANFKIRQKCLFTVFRHQGHSSSKESARALDVSRLLLTGGGGGTTSAVSAVHCPCHTGTPFLHSQPGQSQCYKTVYRHAGRVVLYSVAASFFGWNVSYYCKELALPRAAALAGVVFVGSVVLGSKTYHHQTTPRWASNSCRALTFCNTKYLEVSNRY